MEWRFREPSLLRHILAAIPAGVVGFVFIGVFGNAWLAVMASVASGVIAELALEWRAARVKPASAHHPHWGSEFLQHLLDTIPMPIYVKDAEGRVLAINRAQNEQWGSGGGHDLVGANAHEQNHGRNQKVSKAEDVAVLAGEQIFKEEHFVDASGREHFRVITKGSCPGPDGARVIVCARFDTSAWRLAERTLQQALERETLLRQRTEEFIQRIIDVIPDPFYIKDREGLVRMVNEAYLYEHALPRAELIGQPSVRPDSLPELSHDTRQEDLAVLSGATIDKEQHYLHPANGEERFRQVSKRLCTGIDGEPLVVVAHFNITRWKQAERQVARLANEDALTGLPNRRSFTEAADRLLHSARRHKTPLSLLMFDLDHFKMINDQHGHLAGDQVLKTIAGRINDSLRTEDVPCRWGGEEFAILLPMTTLEDARIVAERLRAIVADSPFKIETREIVVTISGGICQYAGAETLEEFVSRADAALYEAKYGGRNRFIARDLPPD